MSDRKLELIVGTFIIAGVILIAGMILFVADFSVFGSNYKVVIRMNHIGDLQKGAPVKRGGVQIGSVSEISLQPNHIRIIVDIRDSVTLTSDCTASIETAGVVGDTFLEFSQGTSSEKLKNTARTLQEALDQKIIVEGSGSVSMNELFHKVEMIGNEVISITKNVNEIIGDDKVKQDIRETIANVNATTIEAKRLLTSLNRAASNVEIASRDIIETTSSVRKMAATAEEAINDTIGDKKNREAINELLNNTRNLSRELSSKSKAIGETIENIKAVTAKANQITSKIDSNKIGSAVDSLSGAINNAGELIETIRSEIAIALVINKGADRIIQQKFDEMNRRGEETRNDADKQLEEFRRWVGKYLKQGFFPDPAYPEKKDRPYDNVGKTEKKNW